MILINTRKKTAAVVGHICLDLTPSFGCGAVEAVSELLCPGRLVRVGEVDIHTGGSVANTGLAMKLLGAEVRLMGKVGSDDFGETVLRILRRHDADKGMIISQGGATSYSVVLSIPGVDRIFLHNPGANDTFSYEDIDWETVASATLMHFGYPTLMKRMYDGGGEELVRVFRRAKELGVVTTMDMAAIDAASEAAAADWTTILQRVLPYVDIFLPSAEELCFMLDRPLYEQWVARSGGDELTGVITLDEVEQLADRVLGYGAKVAVIKCGPRGLFYRTGGEQSMAGLCAALGLSPAEWCGRQGFQPSFVPERMVSATGAGDTCIAAFLTAALEGSPLERCIRLAAATGACCCTAYDALSGLVLPEELERRIASGWAVNAGGLS